MLALKEVYRPVTVREGDKILTLPAIQAVPIPAFRPSPAPSPARRGMGAASSACRSNEKPVHRRLADDVSQNCSPLRGLHPQITEHNLDLAFNSLDAQREACEAYIKSQAHEGWAAGPLKV
jgi:hypothetical protein